MTNTILLIIIVIIQIYVAYKITDFKKLFKRKENSELDEDDLYEEARKIVLENRKASTSLLQRKLNIGYSKSARLMDMLEDRGVVGEADGTNPRRILIDK